MLSSTFSSRSYVSVCVCVCVCKLHIYMYKLQATVCIYKLEAATAGVYIKAVGTCCCAVSKASGKSRRRWCSVIAHMCGSGACVSYITGGPCICTSLLILSQVCSCCCSSSTVQANHKRHSSSDGRQHAQSAETC